MRHLAVVALHQVALLGVETESIPLLEHLLHAPVQLRVEGDRVLVGGQRGASCSSISWISGVASAELTV